MEIINLVEELKVFDYAGIYAIKNTNKNIYYIGSSENISTRIGAHKVDILKKFHTNKKLRTDLQNGDNFIFIVLEKVSNLEELENYESYYTGIYDSIRNGYNIKIPKRNNSRTDSEYYDKIIKEKDFENKMLKIIIDEFFRSVFKLEGFNLNKVFEIIKKGDM